MQLTGGPRNLPAEIDEHNQLLVNGDIAARESLLHGNYYVIHSPARDSDIADTILIVRNDGNHLFSIDRISVDGGDVVSTYAIHRVSATYTNAGAAILPVCMNSAIQGGGFNASDLTCTSDETGNTQGTVIKELQTGVVATSAEGASWEPLGGYILARGIALGLDVVAEVGAGSATFEGHFIL